MAKPTSYDQFILFGDSITEQSSIGLVAGLQEAYIRRLDVINRGFSGYNTKQALKILPHALPSPAQARIRFMTVFFGANDACIPGANNGQHVALSEYKRNLLRILTHPSVVAHSPRLILVTPTPLEERRFEARNRTLKNEELNRFNSITATYAEAVREVGQELGIAVLDLWHAFQSRAGVSGESFCGAKTEPENEVLKSLLPDGAYTEDVRRCLHFSHAAYEVVLEELMKLIAINWPDQTPENTPYVFPKWDDTEDWAEEGFTM